VRERDFRNPRRLNGNARFSFGPAALALLHPERRV
jgi:hypothetical protein